MQKRWLGILALCLLASAAGGQQTGLASPGGVAPAEAPGGAPAEYVTVRLAGGADAQQQRQAGAAPPTLAEQGYRSLAVPAGQTAQEYLSELRTRPDIVYAEEQARVYAAAIPNDPYYLQGSSNQASYLAQIGAPAAWDLSTGRNSVVVAVLDSGIDVGHPDLAGRLWENTADADNDGIDDDGNGCIDDRYGCRMLNLTQDRVNSCGYTSSARTGAITDDHGGAASHSHGTLVSGVIGAAGDNALGVTGVAWDVRIMPVKVLDCGVGPFEPSGEMTEVADGIEYAVRNGANIINLSLATRPPHQKGDIAPLRAALQMAQDAGVIVVAAAGNISPGASDVGPGYPAAYTQFPNLLAIGSYDNGGTGGWANFSSYGPALDFAAPGRNILSTSRSDIGNSVPYSEVAQGGTSFSAPLVSGMFALMMSRNTRLSAAEYIQAARDTATAAAPAPHGQNWAGSGIINMGAAVARIPMTVTGSPMRDWRDVPAGTEIRATIDGQECGSAVSDVFGPVARYSLRVKSASETAGCGAPGKVVQVTVGGQPAVPTLEWGGSNANLGLANRDVSSVSPPPGALVVQTLNGQWSNVAHLEPGGNLPGAAFGLPTPWTTIYRWDPGKTFLDRAGGYRRFINGAPSVVNDMPTVQTYDAFWVNAPAANPASPNPNPPAGRAIALQPGWNNFTYTGNAKAVADALSSISGKYGQVLQFDNATSTWLSYLPAPQPRYLNDFGGLFKLKVYWVYMTEAATLVMN